MLCPMSDTDTPPDGLHSPVNYDSPKDLAALLESLGFAMQKKFGQNFLVNQGARSRILSLVQPEPGQRIWEIGPGAGAMTFTALQSGLELSTFEIDHGFARFLRQSFGDVRGFELYEGDFLDTWQSAIAVSGKPARIFGNLPYNAASAMISAMIEGDVRPPRMVFTVQKEGAARMSAKPCTKNYSAFSVLCLSAYKVKTAFDLSAGVFWPQPRVTSSVVVMEARTDAIACAGRKDFTRFTRGCFASRRKTLRNNLKALGYDEERQAAACATSGISADLRAEALSPEEFAGLFAALQE